MTPFLGDDGLAIDKTGLPKCAVVGTLLAELGAMVTGGKPLKVAPMLVGLIPTGVDVTTGLAVVVGTTRCTTLGFGATIRTALPFSSSNAILLGNFKDSILLMLGREVIALKDLFVSKLVMVGVVGVPVGNIGAEAFTEGSLVALLWGVDASGVPGGVITANTGISGAVATNSFFTFVFSS